MPTTRQPKLSNAPQMMLVVALSLGCDSLAKTEPLDGGAGGLGGAAPNDDSETFADCHGGCAPGQTCCDGACVELESDIDHCGTCGHACLAPGGTSSCELGECAVACDSGRVDCDGVAENGCEEADPGPPEEVRLLRPMVGAFTGSVAPAELTGSLRPTFSWRSSSGGACDALVYELEVDDSCPIEGFADCAFESPEVRETTADTELRVEADLPVSVDVPVGTRYFWRVRACDEFERCASWSPVRYLDVGRDRQDVTGDGYPDLVVRDDAPSAGWYTLYLGRPDLGIGPDGQGSALAPSRVFAEAGTSREFEQDNPPVIRFVGDVNGDGFQDFVADGPALDAYLPPDGVRTPEQLIHCPTRLLYLGSADSADIRPVFFSTSSWAPGGLAHNFAAGDFDVDGYADVWAAQSVEFAPGDGETPTREARVFLFRGRPDIAALPFPEDPQSGSADFTGTWQHSASLEARADDDGDFLGVSVEPGDFNGDGFLDAAVVAPRAHRVYLVVGGAVDTVVDRAIPYGGLGAGELDCQDARLAVGDFNGDGFDDFAINCAERRLVEVYLGGHPLPETMEFERLLNPDVGGSLEDTLAVDLDFDGFVDLITGSDLQLADSAASVWLLPGLRSKPEAPRVLPLVGARGYFGAADHNGDGHVDLVVSAWMGTWTPGSGTLDPFVEPNDPFIAQARGLLGDGGPLATRTIGR